MLTTHRGEEARAGKQAASCTVVGVESVRRRAHAEPDLRIEDPFTVYALRTSIIDDAVPDGKDPG